MIDTIDIHNHAETTAYVIARHEYVHAVVDKRHQTRADVNVPLRDGSTAVYVAAEGGYAHQIQILAEMGADVNTPNENGWTPVIVATCNDQVEVIQTLAAFGANLNTTDNNNDSAVTIAAWNGCVASLQVLAVLGADIDLPDEDGATPLFTAHVADQAGSSVTLMTLGADVSQYMAWSLHSGVSPARKLFYDFFDNCDAPLSPCMCPLFSLTKLMSSVMATDKDDVNVPVNDTDKTLPETYIANALHKSVSLEMQQHMQQQIAYPVRRKLCRLAWRVYKTSLKLDGDRITQSTKALRYAELLNVLCDNTVLADVYALRVTCKANHEIRRFPVCRGGMYRELEANLIESFVAPEASRFLATRDIAQALGVHHHAE
jgi:hypothetical protein